jgi:hypothetical protein
MEERPALHLHERYACQTITQTRATGTDPPMRRMLTKMNLLTSAALTMSEDIRSVFLIEDASILYPQHPPAKICRC